MMKKDSTDRRLYAQEYRRKQAERKVCRTCGQKIDGNSRTFCEVHRLRHNEQSKKRNDAKRPPSYAKLQSELTELRGFVRSQFKFSTEYYEGFCDEGVFYIREVGGPERVQARGDNALVAIEKLIRKEV